MQSRYNAKMYEAELPVGMEPKILKSEADYEEALVELHKHLHAIPGTPEADRLEMWAKLVEDYENIHYPIAPPDTIGYLLG